MRVLVMDLVKNWLTGGRVAVCSCRDRVDLARQSNAGSKQLILQPAHVRNAAADKLSFEREIRLAKSFKQQVKSKNLIKN